MSGGIRQAPVVTVRDIPTQLLSHADGGFFEPLAYEHLFPINFKSVWALLHVYMKARKNEHTFSRFASFE